LAARNAEIELQDPLAISRFRLKSDLSRNTGHHLGLHLEVNQFVLAGLKHLHRTCLL